MKYENKSQPPLDRRWCEFRARFFLASSIHARSLNSNGSDVMNKTRFCAGSTGTGLLMPHFFPQSPCAIGRAKIVLLLQSRFIIHPRVPLCCVYRRLPHRHAPVDIEPQWATDKAEYFFFVGWGSSYEVMAYVSIVQLFVMDIWRFVYSRAGRIVIVLLLLTTTN